MTWQYRVAGDRRRETLIVVTRPPGPDAAAPSTGRERAEDAIRAVIGRFGEARRVVALDGGWPGPVAPGPSTDEDASARALAEFLALQAGESPGGRVVVWGVGEGAGAARRAVALVAPLVLALVVDDPGRDPDGPAAREDAAGALLVDAARADGLDAAAAFLDGAESDAPAPFLDEETRRLMDPLPPVDGLDYEQLRRRGDAMSVDARIPEGLDRDVLTIGGVPTRRIARRGAPVGCAVVVVHGGGFVCGRAAGEDERCADLVVDFTDRLLGAGATTVATYAPDYRLAPEHPHPVGRDDCAAVVRGVIAAHPGVPVVLYGDSAGAGMVNQVLTVLDDAELDAVSAVVMLEPCLSPALSSLSFADFEDGPMWPRSVAESSWRHYCRDGAASWEVNAPIRRVGPGFPPVLVVVNPVDPLRDEAVARAGELIRAGARVEVHCYAGTRHGLLSVPGTRIWERVKSDIIRFLGDNADMTGVVADPH
ncbi:alpha/beta hydrolase [Actinomyces sp. B33]|uniref:alpha/beta hydrolase fold domain-containing protein n=1 Tax=Actinomyces sp. B33 TaxID=2942131 RepID=UPI0023427AEF|nr:alpha/beta hydrolase fold domain-containing protein [Actinomyces sp. B33]MDC4233576.1 alpha/beta hydrolase [Actinomyces sp. B33]